MAVLLGDVESTALLVSVGADPGHLMKTFASSQLYDAVVATDRQQVKYLLRYDVDLDVNLPFGAFAAGEARRSTSPVHDHSRQQHGAGASTPASSSDADGYRYEGLTPLTVAAQLTTVDVLDIIRLLQKHGADVNKAGPGGSSPLAEAARIGSARMVEFLVDQGADVELRNPAYGGATAVLVAVINRRHTVVDVLIAFGAKLDKPLDDGRTALTIAMETNNRVMIETLLEASLSENYCNTKEFMYEMAKRYRRVDQAGSDAIMRAITEKMRELARIKEEQQHQQQRDSDTMSTIAVTPFNAEPAPLNRSSQISRLTAPSNPEARVERATAGRALRRVETDLPPPSDGVTERPPRADRPASDGEPDDPDRERGRPPGSLKRWPDVGRETAGRVRDNDDDTDDGDTSDDDDDDDASGNNNNNSGRPVRAPAAVTRGASTSLQSSSTATPDDSSLVPAHSTDSGAPARTIVTRATVI